MLQANISNEAMDYGFTPKIEKNICQHKRKTDFNSVLNASKGRVAQEADNRNLNRLSGPARKDFGASDAYEAQPYEESCNAYVSETIDEGCIPAKSPAVTQRDDKPIDVEIIKEVADICNLTESEIIGWLTELGIYPMDLQEQQNASVLVRSLLGEDDPVSLLKMSEYQAMVHSITKTVQQIEQSGEISMVPISQETLRIVSDLHIERDEGNQPILTDAAFIDAIADEEPKTHTGSEQQSINAPGMPKPSDTAPSHANGTSSGHSQHTDGEIESGHSIPETHQQFASFDASFNAMPQNANTVAAVTAQASPANGMVDTSNVMNQILSHVKVQSIEGVAEIKMTLKPEALGDVTLKIATLNGIVTAQFVAESQRIKEVIEANFSLLRDSLQQQGVNISELSVSVRQDGNSEQLNQFAKARQSSRGRISRLSQPNAVAEGNEPARRPNLSDGYTVAVNYTI